MPIRSKRIMRRGKRISRKRNNRGKRSRVVIRRSKKGGATEMNSDNVVIQKSQLEELNAMIDKHADEMKVGGFLGVARMVDKLLNQPVPAADETLEEENSGVEPNTIVNENEMRNENENLNMMSPEPVSENENLNENMGSPEPSVNENENSEELNTPSEELNTPEQKSNMTLDDVTTESDESPEENKGTPESQVGGYYKRFIKSKKNNKKSVML